MKKVLIFLNIFLFVFNTLFAQQADKKLDLEKNLNEAKDDIAKIEALILLGENLVRSEPPKARKYALLAMDLAEKLNYSKGKINSCFTLGNSYYLEGNYGPALEYYLKSLVLVEKSGDKKGIANSYMGISNIYSAQYQYKPALEYQLKSLKIREEINDKDGISWCLNNIGAIYMEQELYDEALTYMLKSLKLKREIGDKKGTSSNLGNIGTIYYEKGMLDEAQKFQEEALAIRKEMNNKKGISMGYVDLGKIYLKQKKYVESAEALLLGSKMANEVGYKVAMKEAYLRLSNLYELVDSNAKSLAYFKKFTAVKDSMFNKENSNKILEMETKFESQHKQKEIELLTKDKALMKLQAQHQELELTNEKIAAAHKSLDLEIKEHELVIQKHQTDVKNKELIIIATEADKQLIIKNNIIFGFIIACVLLLLLYIGIRAKIKDNIKLNHKNTELSEANEIIKKKKDEIEKKNKNITDSINYAERIQQAILPTPQQMNKGLGEYFVYYKPKEIVSGDFYAHFKRDDKIIIAVADCTGHGVPGALMGMIGHDSLNQIIIEKEIYQSNEILNQLNKRLKTVFKRDDEVDAMNDGMEIAICTIDLNAKTIDYAGSMRPLYCFNKEFQKIAADKTPIGGNTNENFKYKSHLLNYKNGDTFYLFTDGYSSQFGGTNSKKYTLQSFKTLLSEIQNESMDKQKQILDITLSAWKGNIDQVDDILVFGFRL